MTDGLTAAEAALEKGDREEALDALLVAWRKQKAAELAGLIDVLSEDLARSRPALDTGAKDFHARWMAVEGEGLAADVARLGPGLWAEPTSTLGLRVERLVARGEDPRTGRALLAMIEHIPTTSSSNFSVWVRAFKALPSILDASAKETLAALRERKPKTTSQFWPKFHGWIDKLMGELSAPVALDAKDAKRARAMLARARELAKEKAPVIARSSPRTVAKAATSPFAALSEASGRTPRRR